MIKIIFKTSIYLCLLLSTLTMSSQVEVNNKLADNSTSKYTHGMQQALQLRQENKSIEALHMFERIASIETGEWLPKYYIAEMYIYQSFGEKEEGKLSALLLKAQNYINEAIAITKDNPDLMVLQALLYTSWITYDAMQYGMLYGNKANDLYTRALAIAPDNPRIVLAKAEWDIGGAKYYGKSEQSYCKDIQKAIELFATFKPTEAFYPTYGKERALKLLETTCK